MKIYGVVSIIYINTSLVLKILSNCGDKGTIFVSNQMNITILNTEDDGSMVVLIEN